MQQAQLMQEKEALSGFPNIGMLGEAFRMLRSSVGPGSTVDEALRMPAVGVIKDVLPRCLEFVGQAMVDGVGGEQPEAAVTVFLRRVSPARSPNRTCDSYRIRLSPCSSHCRQ